MTTSNPFSTSESSAAAKHFCPTKRSSSQEFYAPEQVEISSKHKLTYSLSVDSRLTPLQEKEHHPLQDQHQRRQVVPQELQQALPQRQLVFKPQIVEHSQEVQKQQQQQQEPQQQDTDSSENEGTEQDRAKVTHVRYTKTALHGLHYPAEFDHNFVVTERPKMALLPKHLPPIREMSQIKIDESSKQPETVAVVVQPQIRSSHKSGDSSSSPAAERQTRLRNKVRGNGAAIDLPELNQSGVARRVLKPQPHITRVQDGETGSETPSPLSSPSTSSYDDDDNKSTSTAFPAKTSSFKKASRKSTKNDASPSLQDEQEQVLITSHKLVKKKSISMASLVSSKESDSEDNLNKNYPYRLTPHTRSLREHQFPESLGPITMNSIPRDLFDSQLPKSRSLACLAAATVAQMAGTHPLMVKEARARSYLVGSVGHTSMLGSEELERYFPGRKLRLFVGSWNMNGQTPPVYLADFLLPQNIEFVPDLLVIGTQECMGETKEWEARLQDTLGPSHVLFHSHNLGTLHLAIFIRRDLIWFCSAPEVDSFSTRPGSTFKTKGAVAIAFLLFGTSFLFVNSHLTAHQVLFCLLQKNLTNIIFEIHYSKVRYPSCDVHSTLIVGGFRDRKQINCS